MKNNYIFKIMTLHDLYVQFIENNQENRDVFSRIKYLDTSLQSKEVVFCYFDKNKIIVSLVLEKDTIYDNIFYNKFIAVDPSYARQGLAKKLIEEQFIYVKNENGSLINSKYSPQGFMYIKKYIDLYANLYKVNSYEFGTDEKLVLEDSNLKNKIKCTLLISPPGGGKTTWIKNNASTQEDIYDDISVNKNALSEIDKSIREKRDILIADVNLCDHNILKKAWQTLLNIADNNNMGVNFQNIVFLGEKEEYLNNIIARNDARNVKASLERFYPLLDNLITQQFIGDFYKVKVFKNSLKLSNNNKV